MNELPNESWNVEKLGQFCNASQKRLAVEAWRFGHALNLARAKQNHGEWQTWKRKYVPGLGHSSEHRYRQLALRLTEESLEGIGLTEAYRLLDLTYTKKDASRLAEKAEAERQGVKKEPTLGVGEQLAVGSDDPGWDDYSDDPAGLPELPAFKYESSPIPVTGPVESAEDVETAPVATGLLDTGEVEGEPDDESWDDLGLAEKPSDNLPTRLRYKQHLETCRQHMRAIRGAVTWFKQEETEILWTLWNEYGSQDFLIEVELTQAGLQWMLASIDGEEK